MNHVENDRADINAVLYDLFTNEFFMKFFVNKMVTFGTGTFIV